MRVQDLEMRAEFRKLRGDYGLKKTALDMIMDFDIVELHNEIKNNHKAPKVEASTYTANSKRQQLAEDNSSLGSLKEEPSKLTFMNLRDNTMLR